MVKFLIGLGAIALLVAAVPDWPPHKAAGPLGVNDYLPPLTQARSREIGLEDLRPGEVRICHQVGYHWGVDNCTLRGLMYVCQNREGVWSRDTHTWTFDGQACRYSVKSECIDAPKDTQR